MALTKATRSWRWIQIAFLAALGALALASAAWGQVVESIANDDPVAQAQDNAQGVAQANANWPQRSIQEISIDPRDTAARKPADNSAELIDSSAPDHWFNASYGYQVFEWEAPNLRYNPLYFEDVGLERYGQVHWGHWDAARSSLLFYGGVLALPFNMHKVSPHDCETPLGFARPGSPAPATHNYLLYRN
jgi:hypothetical protein